MFKGPNLTTCLIRALLLTSDPKFNSSDLTLAAAKLVELRISHPKFESNNRLTEREKLLKNEKK
jgi:hypothetical protein